MSGTQRPVQGPAAGSRSQQRLEDALTALDGSALPFAVRFIHDEQLRNQYRQSIGQAAAEIRADVAAGRITPEQGAMRAQQIRNEIMALTRDRSSDLGRAMAENLKQEGKTFEALVATYSQRLFELEPAALSATQRTLVMREIIGAASRSNAGVNSVLRFLGPASRGVMALSLGLAILDIYRSPDRPKEALHQGIVFGAGVGGSFVAGALATSLVCGPGAPVCLGIMIVVGGVSFAAGADYFWRRMDMSDGRR